MCGAVRIKLPSPVAIRVETVTQDLDVQSDEEGRKGGGEEGKVGSSGAGRRGAKPKDLSVQMSSVVTAQFGQVLLGPTITISDNESVDKTLLYFYP